MSLTKGLNKFVKKWAKNMQDMAPVRTGTLKNSIKPLTGPDPAITMVGYGQFVNDGHRTRGTTKVPPNPKPDGFIDPTFDETFKEMEEALPEEVFKQIEVLFDKTFK